MQNRSEIYAGARKHIAGLNQHENELGVMHVTKAILKAALDGAQAEERKFQTARGRRKTALRAQKAARGAAAAFAEQAREALRPYLGKVWSVSWTQAGFKNNSLALPTTIADLVETVGSLESYFTAHPAHENAGLDITGAIAKQRRESLEAAIAAANDTKTEQRTQRDARDMAEAELVAALRKSRSELSVVLPAEDQRWLDFIKEVPADELRPEAVTDVEFDLTTARHIKGSWEEPARAERFLVRVKIVGVDTEFRHVKTVLEPEFDLNTFQTGARVQVQVTAANSAGESTPSPAVELVVG